MYHKYQTEAVVVGARERGEADRYFSLYTRDFGLIHARASSVRSERSRMRYALQDLSRVQVGLVRGVRGWRVTGASSLAHMGGEPKAAAAYARLARLVGRLVAGEEQNTYLFSALIEAHVALSQKPCPAWATIELMCAARVLFCLGYIASDTLQTAMFTHTGYAATDLQDVESFREKLLASVNRAIAETQL